MRDVSFKVMRTEVAAIKPRNFAMSIPSSATSPTLPIQADQRSFAVYVDAAPLHAGLGSRMDAKISHPAIRLLSGTLLLCSAVGASAQIVPSPAQVDFGYQIHHTTSPPQATTLWNTGNASVTVVAVSAASGVFARVGGSCAAAPFTIAGQANCTIEHTCTPYGTNTFYQTITLTLAGGDHVDFGLRCESQEGHLSFDPLFGLSWGLTPVGTIGDEKLVFLSNVGPVRIIISEIVTYSVPAVSAFVRTGGNCPAPPFEIGAGGGCNIAYVFVPTQVGGSTSYETFRTDVSDFPLTLEGQGADEIPLFKDGFDGSALVPIP